MALRVGIIDNPRYEDGASWRAVELEDGTINLVNPGGHYRGRVLPGPDGSQVVEGPITRDVPGEVLDHITTLVAEAEFHVIDVPE